MTIRRRTAGFAFENISGRLYYAPRYFGSDGGAVYGELNGAQRVFDRVRLLAHVGISADQRRESL